MPLTEYCWGKGLMQIVNPQERTKERLSRARDMIKIRDCRFERRQVV